MDIEEVSSTDLVQLMEIAKIAVLQSVDAPEEVKQEIITDTNHHLEAGLISQSSVFLKKGGEDIKGFILIQDYWNLSDLFVIPKYHGEGIGKELFLAALEKCKNHTNKNYIRVNSSLNAQSFYKSVGFEEFIPERTVPEYVVPFIYNF